MSTDLSSASVPQFYRQVFDACSNDGQPVLHDVYKNLLTKCKLSTSQVEKICNLVGTTTGDVNRTNFYKTLALIAWNQQGKQVSDKLFENFTGKEYPTPEISDIAQVKNMKIQLFKQLRSAEFNYSTITKRDSINVHLVPEKKGIFLKYSEYIVTSERFKTKVTRRYNDFVALKELLLNRFPYRLIPSLPPKKIVSDAHFLESRRRALQRWLTLVSRHPVISQDAIMMFFLTDQGPDCQHRIKDIFGRIPDEFMTSDIAATAKDLLPPEYSQIAVNSQNIRTLVNVIGKMKHLTEENVERHISAGRDFEEFMNQLKTLSTLNVEQSQNNLINWNDMQRGFNIISRDMATLSSKSNQHGYLQQNEVCERLGLLLDILVAHKDLCERLEKGLHHDHAVALSKLLSMKKRKIQGVIRGTDIMLTSQAQELVLNLYEYFELEKRNGGPLEPLFSVQEAESVEHLESKMLTQESVITNMELRADFSLYCVHMETRLVYAYLETLSDIMKNLLNLQIKSHSELQEIWSKVQTSAQPFFRCDNQINGDSLNKN